MTAAQLKNKIESMSFDSAINYVLNTFSNSSIESMGDKNIARININDLGVNSVMFFNNFPMAYNVTFNWK